MVYIVFILCHTHDICMLCKSRWFSKGKLHCLSFYLCLLYSDLRDWVPCHSTNNFLSQFFTLSRTRETLENIKPEARLLITILNILRQKFLKPFFGPNHCEGSCDRSMFDMAEVSVSCDRWQWHWLTLHLHFDIQSQQYSFKIRLPVTFHLGQCLDSPATSQAWGEDILGKGVYGALWK